MTQGQGRASGEIRKVSLGVSRPGRGVGDRGGATLRVMAFRGSGSERPKETEGEKEVGEIFAKLRVGSSVVRVGVQEI